MEAEVNPIPPNVVIASARTSSTLPAFAEGAFGDTRPMNPNATVDYGDDRSECGDCISTTEPLRCVVSSPDRFRFQAPVGRDSGRYGR
jgi:hypothetical protein